MMADSLPWYFHLSNDVITYLIIYLLYDQLTFFFKLQTLFTNMILWIILMA